MARYGQMVMGSLCVLAFLIGYVQAGFLDTPECASLRAANPIQNTTATPAAVQQTIAVWQGVLLIISFGAFALFIALIHRIVRTYIYYDSHLLDTFFDGGSDVNGSMVAVSIVAKWTWASTIVLSSAATVKYGLVGHFWYSAAGAVQIFIFAIMVAEIRIKAPGAKTFLQVIRVRYGAVTHTILITFSLVCSVMVIGMVMSEGTVLISGMVQDLQREVVAVIIAIVVAVFSVVGGVGGYMYVAYFSVAFISASSLVFFADTYYNPLKRSDHIMGAGNYSYIHGYLACAEGDTSNDKKSMLTFASQSGLISGVLLILSGFSPVFVSQSFWQSGVAAKPSSGVFGFITGGLAWFAVPFMMSFSLGFGYVIVTLREGRELLSEMEMVQGFVPLVAAQKMMGITGDFLLYVVIIIAVITSASSEVLGASSVLVYDIYQTYIAPFHPAPLSENKTISLRMQKAIQNEEYLEYDRRCVVLKHVVVVSLSALLIPIALIILAIGIDVPWLFLFNGILVGSCVVPIGLAITWHRVTGAGVSTGAVGGFIVAFVAWLVYASTFEGGLNDFRKNTYKPEAMLTGNALALGAGGIFCILVSLSCGGCDQDLQEDGEWQKTRDIDNPVLPWHVKYAPNIGQAEMKNGRPHFFTVRGTFKQAEIGAYVFGVLFAVILVLVWPACMLYAGSEQQGKFGSWTLLVLVWGCIATCYLIIIPLICEIYQTCRQAYYNRMWARAEQRDRFSVIGSSTMASRKDPSELEDGTINPAYEPYNTDTSRKSEPISDVTGRKDDEVPDSEAITDNDVSPSDKNASDIQENDAVPDNDPSPSESSGNTTPEAPPMDVDVIPPAPPLPQDSQKFKTFIHLS